tara:strand:+ start:3153 stop:4139 length:987 start_codon:yes stop_codon:yes gene_type:complete
MPVINVALIGSEKFARSIAKRGDVRDIESYVFKEGSGEKSRIISFLRPLKHPESIRPLLSVLNVAKAGIIEISKIDAALGEILVSFSCAGIQNGMVIINPEEDAWIDEEQISVLLSQAGLPWQIYNSMPEPHRIRSNIFDMFNEREILDEQLILPIDQHFVVQGIGLVGIGYVQSGIVKKHDSIEALPLSEKGIVRSLQVMDDDVNNAFSGDRVGLAIRNLREEALEKGCIIVHSDSKVLEAHSTSKFELINAPFQKKELKKDDIVHVSTDLQFVVGRILEILDNTLQVKWDNPLYVRTNQNNKIVIVQLDATPMRIIGTANNLISVP